MPDGQYQVRMRAVAHEAGLGNPDTSEAAVEQALAVADGDEIVEQAWDLAIGKLATPSMPFFQPLATNLAAAPAPAPQAARPSPASRSRPRHWHRHRCRTPYISPTCTARPTTAMAARPSPAAAAPPSL
ncbi:hypothetical protein LP420_17605 [Massilia sp. B-10]|nr:hypothetical protein LP420_17605 [Massilia sp. B-10]